jgi:hypothetical protein
MYIGFLCITKSNFKPKFGTENISSISRFLFNWCWRKSVNALSKTIPEQQSTSTSPLEASNVYSAYGRKMT